MVRESVPLRIMARSSSSVMEAGSERYLSIKASSRSATDSRRWLRYSSTVSCKSAGIEVSSISGYLAFSSFIRHSYALSVTRSTTPVNDASCPIGICIGQGLTPSRFRIWSSTAKKLAPSRSILFTKATLGTPYLSDWRHTDSLCGCTPPTAQKTATAPSSTRKQRSTSTAKSTCPGVSIRLNWYVFAPHFQLKVVAAEVMVIPRSRSAVR